MIRFFVKDKELCLGSDFSFTMIDENPEIMSSGEFSLDITISLAYKDNVIAFEWLNRLNNTAVIQKADALLVIDNTKRYGTIIIDDNTDQEVTFQFISGNSELRYNAKADGRKIWELEGWGAETELTFAKALQTIGYSGYGLFDAYHGSNGYQNNFVCAPVMVSDEIVNNFTISSDTASPPLSINGISGKIIMQPYLLYYINKLPEVLEYTLKSNILNEDERAKKMYLLNSVDSLNYADALPDMTVTEFIEAIESFFNVSFIVNSQDKTISIQSLQSNLSTKKIVVTNKIINGFNRKFGEEPKSDRFDFTSIRYDLPSVNFFKYQKLESRIVDKCKIYEFANFAAIEAAVLSGSGVAPDKFVLFRDMELMNDYEFMNTAGLGKPTADCYMYAFRKPNDFDFLKVVCCLNKFSATTNNMTKELVLNIVPAEIVRNKFGVSISGGTAMIYTQLPKSSNGYYISDSKGFIESIDGAESTINRINKIEVALYTGRIKTHFEQQIGLSFDVPTLYPFSHIDIMPEFSGEVTAQALTYLKTWKNTYFTPVATTTMKLTGENGVLESYHQESIVDTSKEYKFVLLDGPDMNTRNLFIIDNLKYMPISFEREVKEKKSTVNGTFYRML